MSEYIKAFVVGTSFIVVALFYLAVQNVNPKQRLYSYELYTIIAPLYFGVLNMVSLYVANKFELDNTMRYFIMSFVSPLIVIVASKLYNAYDYTENEWLKYRFTVFCLHFVIWNFIIYNLNNLF